MVTLVHVVAPASRVHGAAACNARSRTARWAGGVTVDAASLARQGLSFGRHSIVTKGAGNLCAVRLTEFWRRMDEQFGTAYARSVAKDYVIAGLGDRTVDEALAGGEDAKTVWRAVCEAFRLPERLQ